MAAEENNELVLRTSIPGAYSVTLSNGRKVNVEIAAAVPQLLNTGWTLDFPPNWGAPAHVDVPTLKSWTEFADPGIRYFSGTATYRTTRSHRRQSTCFRPRTLARSGRSLRSGPHSNQRHIAHPTLEASLRGTCRYTSSCWAITFSKLTVTNLWPNRLIGDAQPGVTHRYTWTNIKKFTASSPLLTSGMLGPVTLKTVYVRSIPLR